MSIAKNKNEDKTQEGIIQARIDQSLIEMFEMFFDSNSKMRIEWFDALNQIADKNGIVFVGDSIIQEFCIQEMINSCIPVSNRGIGGDTSANVLARLNSSILDLHPSKVFLLIGTNDLASHSIPLSESIANISGIISKTFEQNPDVCFYLISVLPVNPRINPQTVGIRTKDKIIEMNILLAKTAKRLHAVYLNLYPLFCDEEGFLKQDLTRDGLHLNPCGYQLFIDAVKPYFV
ncbi:MAG: GDSL-type esterase/lipase family protein [Saccharofermentanales bacterium]